MAGVVLGVAEAAVPGNCNLREICCVLVTKPIPMKHIFLSSLLLITVCAFAQDDDFHLDKEYAISKNGTVDLSSSDAEVIITGTSRTATAHVKIDRTVVAKGWYKTKGSFRVEVETENGNLKIREHQNTMNVGVIGYYEEKYKIEIEAPEGSSLVIRGDDGDYFIKNIDGSISMNFDDGDAQLTGCDGSDFRFRLDDGDLKMDRGKGSLDVVADDADVEILDAAFTNINARLDDGDFLVHTSLLNNGDYSIDSEDGMVLLEVLGGGGEFSIRHDDSRVKAEGNFKTLEETESFTKLSLGQGSAKVNMKVDDATVRLMAKN